MTPPEREVLRGWGRANFARSLVYRPATAKEVAEAVADADRRGLTITHRGGGQSYGDAALNQGGAVIQLTGLDRILEFDRERGVIRSEAGVTIDQLWRTTLPAGWWPPVVPGTSRPTLGGCVAMNVHGKNHYTTGTIGDHVKAITVLTPEGEFERITRSAEVDRLSQFIGTQGLFGTIIAVTIRLRRVQSGYLSVRATTAENLQESLNQLRRLSEECEYAVGWVDCFATGSSLGRSELHGADYLSDDHPLAGEGLEAAAQHPPDRMAGIVPRHRAARLLRFTVNDYGIRQLNRAKYLHARLRHPSQYLQPIVQFHFLLDYIPGWEQAYDPGGLIQYQFYVPNDAVSALETALELQHEYDVRSYLGVLKRHRADEYPSSYSVDGYSLALDFPVRRSNYVRLMELVERFDQLQTRVGGRIYAAKDAVSRIGSLPDRWPASYGSNLTRRWGSAS